MCTHAYRFEKNLIIGITLHFLFRRSQSIVVYGPTIVQTPLPVFIRTEKCTFCGIHCVSEQLATHCMLCYFEIMVYYGLSVHSNCVHLRCLVLYFNTGELGTILIYIKKIYTRMCALLICRLRCSNMFTLHQVAYVVTVLRGCRNKQLYIEYAQC